MKGFITHGDAFVRYSQLSELIKSKFDIWLQHQKDH